MYFVSVNFFPFAKISGHNVFTAYDIIEFSKEKKRIPPCLVFYSVSKHEKHREKFEQWLYPTEVGKRS